MTYTHLPFDGSIVLGMTEHKSPCNPCLFLSMPHLSIYPSIQTFCCFYFCAFQFTNIPVTYIHTYTQLRYCCHRNPHISWHRSHVNVCAVWYEEQLQYDSYQLQYLHAQGFQCHPRPIRERERKTRRVRPWGVVQSKIKVLDYLPRRPWCWHVAYWVHSFSFHRRK